MLKSEGGDTRSPDQKALAANVTKAIKESGVKLKEIAEKCLNPKGDPITEQAVSNWKRTGKMAKEHLLVISELTGWSVERLLGPKDQSVAGSASQFRNKKAAWPYKRIDYAKLVGLSGTDAINLENAILAAAGDIKIDIRVDSEENRAAA